MEGRYPSGLLMALTRISDPSKDDDFNYWYNHMHIPDVTAGLVWRYGTRYVNTDPKPGGGKYVAMYETEAQDIKQARAATSGRAATWREQGRNYPLVVPMVVGDFKRVGGEFCVARKPSKGILMDFSNCKDPSKEGEFNRWYEDVYIAEVLDSGLYHAAYRYESAGYLQDTTGGKYLTVFETGDAEPGKVARELAKLTAGLKARGRLFEGVEHTLTLAARRIGPRD